MQSRCTTEPLDRSRTEAEEQLAKSTTRPTAVSVGAFLAHVEDAQKRSESAVLIEMMQRITGQPAKMWGPTIIGFGQYHYAYASGHQGDTCLTGFSPRKAEFSIYLNAVEGDEAARRGALLARLGKHRMGKGCLYVKRLEGLDLGVLERLIEESCEAARARCPTA